MRIGRPLGIAGLPEAAKGPAFAAAVGMMIYPQVAGVEERAVKAAQVHPHDRARADRFSV